MAAEKGSAFLLAFGDGAEPTAFAAVASLSLEEHRPGGRGFGRGQAREQVLLAER
jgi:hypothetical protein